MTWDMKLKLKKLTSYCPELRDIRRLVNNGRCERDRVLQHECTEVTVSGVIAEFACKSKDVQKIYE